MFSQQKKVGFTFVNQDGTLRSVIGTLKAKSLAPRPTRMASKNRSIA